MRSVLDLVLFDFVEKVVTVVKNRNRSQTKERIDWGNELDPIRAKLLLCNPSA